MYVSVYLSNYLSIYLLYLFLSSIHVFFPSILSFCFSSSSNENISRMSAATFAQPLVWVFEGVCQGVQGQARSQGRLGRGGFVDMC